MTKSKYAPKTDVERVSLLKWVLKDCINDFYHSYDPEEDPKGDEIPGFIISAEQALVDVEG